MSVSEAAAVPHHVAIVMDGNGRWAKRRFMPRLAGHRQGVKALRQCVRACSDRGIGILTVFAFSSENWNRPQEEVTGLMDLLGMVLAREVPELHADGVRIRFVGDRQGLSDRARQGLDQAEALTSANPGMLLNVCFNYGGRWDIAQAAARLAASQQPITEESLNGALSLADGPDPDLLIRTGGEMRISNFLMWQCAYSELYFTPTLWPEFDAAELDRALAAYAARERRFGKTSDQVRQGAAAC